MEPTNKTNTPGVFIPIWKRPPNKFIKYEVRDFELPPDINGKKHTAKVTYAVWEDKKGNIQEETAFVKWTCDNCGFHS